MGAKTEISWTDSTWSPLRVMVRRDAAAIAQSKRYTSLVKIAEKMEGHVGPHCEHVSDGCKNCYSGTNNHRCLPANGTGLPFDRRSRDLIEPFVDDHALMMPLRWKTGRRIFVENQSDLFGEWVPEEHIDRVFAVMAMTPRHTYQILTKRPERMQQYFAQHTGKSRMVEALDIGTGNVRSGSWIDPLENVWLGVSVENQTTADARIPLLLQTPAAVRFVSYEPALDAVAFQPWLQTIATPGHCRDIDGGWWHTPGSCSGCRPALDLVIVGGESGPGARPFETQWALNVVRQCETAGVACFVKQLGAQPLTSQCGLMADVNFPGRPPMKHVRPDRNLYHVHLKDKKGGNMEEWPLNLRVRQMPEVR